MGGLKRVSQRRNDALAQTGWQQVESLLAEYYREQGYVVEHCGTGGTSERFDGGVDLKLRRADEFVLVQVKHWNACKVPHNDVHQLLGLMVNEGATGAVLVTSGEFTKAATEAAARQGLVRLVDGDELRVMLGPGMDSPPPPALDRAAEFAAFAADRPPSRRRPDAHSARQAERRATLICLGITLGGGLLFVVLIRGVFEKTRWTAGPSPASTIEASRSDLTPDMQSEEPVGVAAEPTDGNCTGGADGCYAEGWNRPMSDAERRAEQKRADEAMRVIEASTPEM